VFAKKNCNDWRSEIYTLAESGTVNLPQQSNKVLIYGEGTQISDNPTLENRAKRKTITQKMILSLIDVAKEKGDKERIQSYWNSYHCQSKIISSNGRVYGTYCKNRFCTICCAIRKADKINQYYPVLKQWKDPHFVTLTVKSVKEKNLNLYVFGLQKAFRQIRERCKKRHQRGKGLKLIGVKSLECNFNPKTKTYNPHFHIIVPNKEIADLLKKEWMIQWKSDKRMYTYQGAQYIRKVENLERDLIETIKYGSKISTEPDLNKKSNDPKSKIIYVYALDNILCAMKGHRIFDRFGFNLPKQEKRQVSYKFVQDYKEWIFDSTANDWIDYDSGECLTGYSLPVTLEYLLENNIDTSNK